VPSPAAPASTLPADPVIRFEAIGEAFGYFQQRAGVWILAALVAGVICVCANVGLFVPMMMMSIAGGLFLPAVPSFVLGLVGMALSNTVSGIFLGGMSSMALHQIDGHRIRVRDVFPGTDVLPRLALVSFLIGLVTSAVYSCLVIPIISACLAIPGLIISGLFMLALPLVVDARLTAGDALRMTCKTLKDEWLLAALFYVLLWFIQVLGIMLLGLGLLVAMPISVLSIAIVYRGRFSRGGLPAKPSRDKLDPEFEGIGSVSKPGRRIPAWAWLMALAALLTPVVALGLGFFLVVGLVRSSLRGIQEARGAPGLMAIPRAEIMPDPLIRGFGGPDLHNEKRPLGGPGQPARAKAKVLVDPTIRGIGEPELNKGNPPLAGLDGNMQDRQPAEAERNRDPVVEALVGLKSDLSIDRHRSVSTLLGVEPGHDSRRKAEVAAALATMVNDPEVGRLAWRALAKWATADQIPLFIDQLASPEAHTRRVAIEVLGRIGGSSAVRPIAERLTEFFDRNAAIKALQGIGPDSELEMIGYLSHTDESVRIAACQVLAFVGTKKSLAPLQTVARSDPSRRVQRAASQASQNISNRLPGSRPKSRKR
jgi:hypothetical protein